MTTLTAEQRKAIELAGEQPVHIEDPETHASYVILKADVYERLRALYEEGDFDVRETYPLVWDVMKEDWEDPAMDVYDAPEKP